MDALILPIIDGKRLVVGGKTRDLAAIIERGDPKKGERGWKPHRDKGYASLDPNGQPLSLTVWIPLTEASPTNGCMYIIPANLDPTYGTEKDNPFQGEINAARALPAKPGEYLCWNQAVYHWGSSCSEFADQPRISMAFEFQRGDMVAMNSPLLAPAPFPPFGVRLQLIGKQILQYRHMYGFSDTLTHIAEALLKPRTA